MSSLSDLQTETAIDASLLHPAVAASLKGAQADATLSLADRLVASAEGQVRWLQAALAHSPLRELHEVAAGFDYYNAGTLGPFEFERALEEMGVDVRKLGRSNIARLISVCDTGTPKRTVLRCTSMYACADTATSAAAAAALHNLLLLLDRGRWN